MPNRLEKVFSVDKIRGLKILEMFQYTAISVVFTLIGSYCINLFYYGLNLFGLPRKDMHPQEPDNEGMTVSIIRLIFEIFIIVIAYFYIRKMVLSFPSFAGMLYPKFRPNTTNEYTLHVALIMILIELQPETHARIEHISQLMFGAKSWVRKPKKRKNEKNEKKLKCFFWFRHTVRNYNNNKLTTN